MIVTCTNCSTKLQLDSAKIPSRQFSVRCPKCQQIINAQPPAAQSARDALGAVGDLPATTRAQKEATATAPAAPVVRADSAPQARTPSQPAPPTADAGGEALRLLSALLAQGAPEGEGHDRGPIKRPAWERRRALVCVGSTYCDPVARALVDGRYEVCIVGDAAQAAEQMREAPVDVIVLDQEFDMGGQGAIAVARELSYMRMPDRRRVVFVQLSPTARTGDAHAAFLANANLVVNTSDLADLPRALEKNVRDLNDLYRHFNKALGLHAI
ncbi:MAG TPA: zinc-ribbon domain-containing protein [Pyrinomonadaceae bacterium]|nr:zinc-ribbon domain-containing protein [Pyrinomonadaceae bacterium]